MKVIARYYPILLVCICLCGLLLLANYFMELPFGAPVSPQPMPNPIATITPNVSQLHHPMSNPAKP